MREINLTRPLHCDAFVNAQAFHHYSVFCLRPDGACKKGSGGLLAHLLCDGVTMGQKSRAPTVKQRPIFSTKQRPKLSSSRGHFRLFFSLLEPEGIIPGFQDIAVMGDAIEECRGHFGIAEHRDPFRGARWCCSRQPPMP